MNDETHSNLDRFAKRYYIHDEGIFLLSKLAGKCWQYSLQPFFLFEEIRMRFRTLLISAALATVSLLQACGGGGGGASVDVPATPSTPVVPTPVPVVTVPTIADAIAELNRLRTSASVNAMVTSAQVMTAAQNHATYLSGLVPPFSPHSEDPSKLGFTGVTPTDRVKAAGYDSQGVAGEVVAPNNLRLNTQADPMIPLRGLMNAPYHALAMLGGNQDVGMGTAKTKDGQTMYMVIDMAAPVGGYVPIPVGEVRMWPCNGVDNVLHKSIAPEAPEPIVGRNLETNPIGTPIYVLVNESQKLVLTTYELRNTATGSVSAIAKVLGQDVTDGLRQNQMALLPDKPLAVNTIYTATVTGLNAGKSFSKTCTFKTGNLSSVS